MQQTTYIIIINFKTWQHTIECLNSLQDLNNHDFAIRIVEVEDHNNSRSEIRKWVNENQKMDVKIIELDDNLGFAGANNKAIEQVLNESESCFFWLLNNDAVVEPDALDQLIATWYALDNEARQPAFIGSKVIDYNHREIVQTVGGKFNPRTAITSLTGLNQQVSSFPETGVLETDFVMGASMFFHSSIVSSIGLLDESYFLYYEDVDWCYRASEAGFSNYTCLGSIVFHKQGATIGNSYNKTSFNPDTFKYLHSSYIKFVRKHFPGRLPIAHFMLIKQAVGKFTRGRYCESSLIFKVFIESLFRKKQTTKQKIVN